MMTNRTARILLSIPAIATYIGTAVSIWSVSTDKLTISIVALFCVVVILFLYLYNIHFKFTNEKNKRIKLENNLIENEKKFQQITQESQDFFKSIAHQFHKLTHNARDAVTNARSIPQDNQSYKREMEAEIQQAIRSTLTMASSFFANITKKRCTASLMLKDRNNKLVTTLYCHNASPQRSTAKATSLDADQGVAGLAIQTKNVACWKNHDSNFVPTRKEFNKYYKSGISIPFQMGFAFVGLLNIDTLEEYDFTYDDHGDLGAAFADAIALLLECREILSK